MSQSPSNAAPGLEGLRVLELGGLVSAAYAAKLLGDLGADVVKVEAPGGDRSRARGPFPGGTVDREQSGLFLYLNTNKRSVVLDLESDEGRAHLDTLVATADILIHNVAPAQMPTWGLDFERLRGLRPRLVMCSITPFGLTGPYRDLRAEEINVVHAGGWGWLSPGALERGDLPPLKAFGHQADFQGGLAGAMTSAAACYRAQRTGRGEHIDLSVQEYVATILEAALITYTYSGQVATRLGQRGLNPWGIFRARDGLIFLCTIEPDQWERLVDFMGRPAWAELEVFQGFAERLENVDLLKTFVQEWIGEWTVDALYREGQRRRICFAPVLSVAELPEQDHLRDRGFFVDVAHPRAGTLTHLGPPYKLGEPWWAIRRPAPLLGEHQAEILGEERPASGAGVARERPRARGVVHDSAASDPPRPDGDRGLPLDGVRVADFTWVWAGPFCAMQLAHLGAEVIKLESAARPDLGRRLPIFAPDLDPGINRSGYFNQWNQGKKSIRLNLSEAVARDVVLDLVRHCDVVVENFATGVMERLGLGYDRLREIKPDLVFASISGYGDDGPRQHYMAYGPAIAPLAGLASLSGYEDADAEGPREVGISLGDPTAGVSAAAAICAALAARARTGRGNFIDVSLWESTAALVAEGWMEFAMNGAPPPRMGNRDPWMSPHGCFRCAGDDAWVTIACATEAEWRALADRIDPQLADDARFRTAALRKTNEDELEDRIEGWTSTRDRWEVTRALQAAGVPAFPSLSPADLDADPHLEARGFLERLPHPEVGVRTHAGIPWRLATGPNGVRTPAPQLGAHTRAVLRDLLGYSDERISSLAEAKALY